MHHSRFVINAIASMANSEPCDRAMLLRNGVRAPQCIAG